MINLVDNPPGPFIDSKTGVWQSRDSWERRLKDQLRPEMHAALAESTHKAASEGKVPIGIEIGPGNGYETAELIRLSHPATQIIPIDPDPNQKNVAVYTWILQSCGISRIPSIYKGNGWFFEQVMQKEERRREILEHMSDPRLAGKISFILAANNLAIAVHQSDQVTANSWISNFLSNSARYLSPDGVLLLTAGTAALLVEKRNGNLVLNPGNHIEARFLKEGFSDSVFCRTHVFQPWLPYLTVDAPVEPAYTDVYSTLNFTPLVPYTYEAR
jgi:hypothetical protein